MIINAANVQKVGLGGPNITSMQDAQARITGQSVSGVGISALNDPSKGLMNFNIQGTNGKCDLNNAILAAKVISNRPGVSVAGSTPGTIPDVSGYNASNSNLANNGVKINVDSKFGYRLNSTELASNEEDERYRYLLKNGIVRRVEDEDKIIFAELPQIPGVLVVYRKPSERNANPDRLILDKRELTHMPLLEGEEKLRLLNL